MFFMQTSRYVFFETKPNTVPSALLPLAELSMPTWATKKSKSKNLKAAWDFNKIYSHKLQQSVMLDAQDLLIYDLPSYDTNIHV